VTNGCRCTLRATGPVCIEYAVLARVVRAIRLQVTVHPRDAKGFVRVVGELEPSDLPEDFSSIDDEDGPSHTRPFNEKPVPPPVRPKRLLRKAKPKVRPWGGRHTSIFAK
jgi:hypothetical protein